MTKRIDPASSLNVAASRLRVLADGGRSPSAAWAEFDSTISEATAAAVELFGPRPRQARGSGAKARMLEHLLARQGQWVSGEELRAVARIGEWARRIRELRVEDGWTIEERQGAYRIVDAVPDACVAATWKTLNAIRRRDGAARERVRALLVARVGDVVTRDELDYVARIKEGSRRVRELRDEEGWPIESHIDDPSLQPGQYRLVSEDPHARRDPRQRLYEEGVRAAVFERDGFTCQACGRNRAAAELAGDSRFFLEIHHRFAVADQLDVMPAAKLNDPSNLVTLCHADHLKETSRLQRRRRTQRRSP